MNKLISFVKTIRLPNLVMLIMVQWIVSFYFVKDFQLFHYILITSSTSLIALAAYLLNDIADIEIDTINNKLKLIQQYNKVYWFKIAFTLSFVGLLLGLWASYLANLSYFLYFVLTVLLLSIYAFFLSKYKFIGNLIISFLIALAILLCYYVEIAHPFFSRVYYSTSEYSLWIYAAFAFILNWLREIVKDMEDFGGDKIAERWSIPIVLGINISKVLVAAILLFFTFIFAFTAFKIRLNNFEFFYIILLSVFTFSSFIYLLFSKQQQQFARLSFKIKLLMLLGLLIPVFF